MSKANNISTGAYHISNNTVEYNPQRKNNFTLIINFKNMARVGAVDPSIRDLRDKDIIKNGQEQLILALKSSDTPKYSQGIISVSRGNSTIKFPGKPEFQNISIEAYDYIGSDVKDTLLAWQNQSYNSTYDYVGNSAEYKKDCQLLQYSPDGTLIRYWDIKGAWVSEVSPGGFDYESGDAIQTVTATIVYDWAQMKMPEEFVQI